MTRVEGDPVELYLAGHKVSTATDDAAPQLSASTGGGGFPGTSAVAHAALVEAWQREDWNLATGLHAAADLLHQQAETYRATDHANAEQLTRLPPAEGTSPGGGVQPPLNK